jgi:hypothetical protein
MVNDAFENQATWGHATKDSNLRHIRFFANGTSCSELSTFGAIQLTDTHTAVKFIISRDSSTITTIVQRLTYSIIHQTKLEFIFHNLP